MLGNREAEPAGAQHKDWGFFSAPTPSAAKTPFLICETITIIVLLMDTLRANTEENVSFSPHFIENVERSVDEGCFAYVSACIWCSAWAKEAALSECCSPGTWLFFPPPIPTKFPLQQSATSYMSCSHKNPHVTTFRLPSEIHIFLSAVQEKSYLLVQFRLEHRSGESYPETGPRK